MLVPIVAEKALLSSLAATSGGGHVLHGWVGIVVFCVFLAFAIVVTLFRLRRGGPGPQVNWVPKSMRGKINQQYEEHGWQEPYDEDGNRNPDRDSI